MKRLLKIIAGVLAVLVLVVAIFLFYGRQQANAFLAARYDVTPAVTQAVADSAKLVRGQHLVETVGCQACHGDDLSGTIFVDAPPFLVPAPNLTAGEGGIASTYTDADWDRAIRYGVNQAGRGMVVMPSKMFSHLADDDMEAMIAYLKHVPPVDNPLPELEFRAPVGYIVAATEDLDIERASASYQPLSVAPATGPTAAYGAYLEDAMCTACHGADMLGGPHPGEPGVVVPSLLGAASWSPDAFINAMRTGERPSGAAMDAEKMPWTYYQRLTDDELRAIYAHLQASLQTSSI
ncbi:MAG: cytochrome c [Rhodothermales bacterium]